MTKLVDNNESEYEDDVKLSKYDKEKLRKTLKKKKQKQNKKNNKKQIKQQNEMIINKADELIQQENNIIEYIEEDEYIQAGQYYEEFKNVFQYFKKKQIQEDIEEETKESSQQQDDTTSNSRKGYQNINNSQQEIKSLSKKKQKLLNRMPVAQLKALSKRPDLVEAWDVTASDPLLLSFLKGYRNTVQVPKHWCQKRKFLQSKRGVLKQPFQLPDYIEATGIARLRDPFNNDGMKMVKQKLRERMNPKLGKVDIDYEVLHDAFFKYQTKPRLTIFGDIYYEGKENEVKMRTYKPGKMSEQLRAALGIGEQAPPPWIINMQRYGPPPAYPNLKIPGVTVPINETILGNIFFGRNDQGETVYNNNDHKDQLDQDLQYLWGELQDQPLFDDQEEDQIENNQEATNLDFMNTVQDHSGTISQISTLHLQDLQIKKPLYQVIDKLPDNNTNPNQPTLFPYSHTYQLPDNNKFKF